MRDPSGRQLKRNITLRLVRKHGPGISRDPVQLDGHVLWMRTQPGYRIVWHRARKARKVRR